MEETREIKTHMFLDEGKIDVQSYWALRKEYGQILVF
jgi:hypothetical protein